MNLEYGVFVYDLHVSIFEVKRVVTSGPLLLGMFDLLAKLGWGQVGYGGDG